MHTTTRRPLTWDSLTPASPIDTGDVVEVLVDGMEPFRGVYCGIHRFASGRIYAEVAMSDTESEFVRLEAPHRIRLLRESMSLNFSDARDALDARDPQPHRDLRFILAALAASAAFLVAVLLLCWR